MENVVIIGAGPAGLAAAVALAERGIAPVVIESRSEYGGKPCAGLVAEDAYGFPVKSLIHKMSICSEHETLVVRSHGREFRVRSNSGIRGLSSVKRLLAVDRAMMEVALARRAEKAGAEIRLGTPLRRLKRRRNRVILNSRIESRMVVGADGAHSKVRHFIGEDISGFALASVAEVPLARENPCFIFDNSIAPRGYAWLFPKTDESCAIGLGSFTLSDPQHHGRDWQQFTRFLGLSPHTRAKTAFIPASLPCRSYADSVLLAGEAAGLVDSFTGAGINPALLSGTLAGEAAADAILRGKTDASALRGYERSWKRRMHVNLLRSNLYKRLFYGRLQRSRSLMTLMLRWFA